MFALTKWFYLRRLDNPSGTVRMNAFRKLMRTQPITYELVERCTHSTDRAIQEICFREFGKLKDSRAVPILLNSLVGSPPPAFARAAVNALSDIGDRIAIEPLAAALQHRPEWSNNIVQALLKFQDRRCVPFLVGSILAGDTHKSISFPTLRDIERLDPEEAARAIVTYYDKNGRGIGGPEQEIIDRLCKSVPDVFIKAIANDSSNQRCYAVRRHATEQLAKQQDRRLLPILVDALANPATEIRHWALEYLVYYEHLDESVVREIETRAVDKGDRLVQRLILSNKNPDVLLADARAGRVPVQSFADVCVLRGYTKALPYLVSQLGVFSNSQIDNTILRDKIVKILKVNDKIDLNILRLMATTADTSTRRSPRVDEEWMEAQGATDFPDVLDCSPIRSLAERLLSQRR